MKNIILIILLSLSFRIAIARKPAVEPVRELSTSHFEKNRGVKSNSPRGEKAAFHRNDSSSAEASSIPSLLIIFLILLPLGILLAMNKISVEKLNQSQNIQEPGKSNISFLAKTSPGPDNGSFDTDTMDNNDDKKINGGKYPKAS